ncbi:hypothetical protein [Tropicimonas sediminicola]|uniref:hypothetical protein n=1 Tax=Tropicimonas sediminicola TaxID=1031541 RepID=UPI0011321E8D|nr:hypothetical protein [Tropicimonas sediminicola]
MSGLISHEAALGRGAAMNGSKVGKADMLATWPLGVCVLGPTGSMAAHCGNFPEAQNARS